MHRSVYGSGATPRKILRQGLRQAKRFRAPAEMQVRLAKKLAEYPVDEEEKLDEVKDDEAHTGFYFLLN